MSAPSTVTAAVDHLGYLTHKPYRQHVLVALGALALSGHLRAYRFTHGDGMCCWVEPWPRTAARIHAALAGQFDPMYLHSVEPPAAEAEF